MKVIKVVDEGNVHSMSSQNKWQNMKFYNFPRGHHMTSRQSWKINRRPFLASTMNLTIIGSFYMRKDMISFLSTTKQRIFSGSI